MGQAMPDGGADLRLTAKTTPAWLYASILGRLKVMERARISSGCPCSFCARKTPELLDLDSEPILKRWSTFCSDANAWIATTNSFGVLILLRSLHHLLLVLLTDGRQQLHVISVAAHLGVSEERKGHQQGDDLPPIAGQYPKRINATKQRCILQPARGAP